MEWYLYIAVVGAGFVAGLVNTLAGSGSLVSLPLLMFLGLPATVANGTNRIAILMQNVVGVSGFHRRHVLDWRGGIRLAVPALIGAVIGALIAVDLDEEMMRRAIGALMVIMLVLLLARPRRWLVGHEREAAARPGWTSYVIFFAIGLYGGFIQAGVGLFLLAGLVLNAGYDLVRANAVKLLIVLCYTPLALGVFLYAGQVEWGIGLVLAMGNMLGAWVGVRLAVERGAEFVRWLLIVVVIVSAIEFLGVRTWLAGLI